MIYLDDKTQKNIEATIKSVVKMKLLEGFQNRKYQPVAKVEEMQIGYNINEEKSNRNLIVIGPVTIKTRVFVNLKDNLGQATDWLNLRIDTIEFLFDESANDFVISDSQIELIDMS